VRNLCTRQHKQGTLPWQASVYRTPSCKKECLTQALRFLLSHSPLRNSSITPLILVTNVAAAFSVAWRCLFLPQYLFCRGEHIVHFSNGCLRLDGMFYYTERHDALPVTLLPSTAQTAGYYAALPATTAVPLISIYSRHHAAQHTSRFWQRLYALLFRQLPISHRWRTRHVLPACCSNILFHNTSQRGAYAL